VTGYNYRMTNLGCALLCAQLERSTEILTRRRAVFAAYRERLSSVPGIGFQPVAEWAVLAPWMFNVVVDAAQYGRSAAELAKLLEDDGIETRPIFPPLHHQPPFAAASKKRGEELPISDRLAASGLSLPTYNQIPVELVDLVADRVRHHHA
jgi:perosamine synthetase